MAIELFGAEIGVYAALACVVAWLVSGYTGIYRSQRIACLKQSYVPTGIRLAELPAWHQRQTPARLRRRQTSFPVSRPLCADSRGAESLLPPSGPPVYS
jgi:hypothetical protein